MSVSWRAAILAAGLTALGAASAQGYPIPPVSLWNLVEQSETVVVAQVVDISERPVQRGKDEEEFAIPESIATLRILETWKGEAFGEIRVEFPAGLICPAPPRYVEDEDVVAFLSREDGAWTTVGLSYGTLYPEGREELKDLRIMVRRALALQKGRIQKSDRIDWLVEAASRPGTRWHGLYELEPRGDAAHSFYDPERSRKSLALTPAQLQKIAHGFVTHPPVDVTLPMTLKVLAKFPDPRVDETAAAAIEGLLGQERLPYWIDQALTLVLQRFGDRAAKKRVAALPEKEECCGLKEDEVRALWRSAQRELGIPKVAPLRVASRKVRGVGPETPD